MGRCPTASPNWLWLNSENISNSLLQLPHLLHETVVADKTPWRPLQGSYRRRSQLISISRDEILLPLRVTCAKYVDISRHASLVVEADILDLLQDLGEEFDIKVVRHHDKNEPVSKTKVEPGIQCNFDQRCWGTLETGKSWLRDSEILP